jgi:hypothetical protein
MSNSPNDSVIIYIRQGLKSKSFKSFSDEAYKSQILLNSFFRRSLKSQILLKIFFRRSLRLHNVWRRAATQVKVKGGRADAFDFDFDFVWRL